MDLQVLHDSSPASPFLSEGLSLLSENHIAKGLECFETAIRLDPYNPKLFYAQGLSLFEWGSRQNEKKTLLLACKKFKNATQLSSDFFESWQAWGGVLLALGFLTQEHHYFLEAKDKFEKALKTLEGTSHPDLFELYWDCGLVYREIAKHSEEPSDLNLSVSFFEKARAFKEELPSDFFEDLGGIYLQASGYSAGSYCILKAIDALKTALHLNADLKNCWALLAESFKKLYFLTHEKDHLAQADMSFQAALSFFPSEPLLLANWTRFVLDSCELKPDLQRLESAMIECEKALSLCPNAVSIQALLYETRSLVAMHTEDLSLLDSSFKALEELYESEELDSAESLISYAKAFKCKYHYFQDVDFLYQSIEKLQEGLSLDRTAHFLWYQMGKNYTLLHDLHEEDRAIDLSIRFFRKALSFCSDLRYVIGLATSFFKLGECLHSEMHLKEACHLFEHVFASYKQLIYIYPEWTYAYASALDLLGDFDEEEGIYLKAIDLLSNLLLLHPDFHKTHHRMALCFSHLGELSENTEYFHRALAHYRTALEKDGDNDSLLLDTAVTLINLSEYTVDTAERHLLHQDAQYRLLASAKLGNVYSYYHLSCLYSLMGSPDSAMMFLKKAKQNDVLPPVEELLEDDWLDNLRMTRDFQKFLLHLDR